MALKFVCICTILTPQPTKILVLPLFYVNDLQTHATNCQSGTRGQPLVLMSRRSLHACALQNRSTHRRVFPRPIIQGAGAKAPHWKMAGKLEPLKMEPLEVEAEEGEGNEGLSCQQEDGTFVPLQ